MFFNIVCSSSGDCCPACCPSSCNNFTACSLCPPPSTCSQGFHINVEYFHLGQVEIPSQVTERYLTRTLLKVPASHWTRSTVIGGRDLMGTILLAFSFPPHIWHNLTVGFNHPWTLLKCTFIQDKHVRICSHHWFFAYFVSKKLFLIVNHSGPKNVVIEKAVDLFSVFFNLIRSSTSHFINHLNHLLDNKDNIQWIELIDCKSFS